MSELEEVAAGIWSHRPGLSGDMTFDQAVKIVRAEMPDESVTVVDGVAAALVAKAKASALVAEWHAALASIDALSDEARSDGGFDAAHALADIAADFATAAFRALQWLETKPLVYTLPAITALREQLAKAKAKE